MSGALAFGAGAAVVAAFILGAVCATIVVARAASDAVGRALDAGRRDGRSAVLRELASGESGALAELASAMGRA